MSLSMVLVKHKLDNVLSPLVTPWDQPVDCYTIYSETNSLWTLSPYYLLVHKMEWLQISCQQGYVKNSRGRLYRSRIWLSRTLHEYTVFANNHFQLQVQIHTLHTYCYQVKGHAHDKDRWKTKPAKYYANDVNVTARIKIDTCLHSLESDNRYYNDSHSWQEANYSCHTDQHISCYDFSLGVLMPCVAAGET